ncbi:hypothetical protein MB46_02355 [Arthrobacter alpinus]|nr:hypothetical protein MB46_02355 [Arthrobacter alpinus]
MQTMFIATADRFRDGERGATATEYAMLVAGIAVVVAVAVGVFGTALSTFFGTLPTKLKFT